VELDKLTARGFINVCSLCLRVHFPFRAPSFLNLHKHVNNKGNQDDGKCTLSVNGGVILPFLLETSSVPLSQKTDSNRRSAFGCTLLNYEVFASSMENQQ